MRRVIGVVAIGVLLLVGLVGPASAQVCVNINTASFEELRQLNHVDEDRAQQIIDLREDRPFASLQDLDRVDGLNGTGVRLQELIEATSPDSVPPCPIDDDNGENGTDDGDDGTEDDNGTDTDDGTDDEDDGIDDSGIDDGTSDVAAPTGTVDAGSGGLIETGAPLFIFLMMGAGLLIASGGAIAWTKDW